MARVLGVGGVFLKVDDPDAVRSWYARVLGFEVNAWGGVAFSPREGGATTWSAFAADSDAFAPSTAPVMVNFAVDDLDGVLARAAAEGVEPLGRDDSDPHGRFAWLLDPAGIKVELWQAADDAPA